jgi:glucose/arabinose dehydrogenase
MNDVTAVPDGSGPRFLKAGLLLALLAILGAVAYHLRPVSLPPSAPSAPSEVGDRLRTIQLPPGFSIAVYARVPDARSLAVSPHGTVFVGTRASRVYALVDSHHAGVADRVLTLAQGLHQPNGVAFRDGALYVGEISRVLRYDDIEAHLDQPPTPKVVFDALPTDEHHGWKVIHFGPDGKLYVPVGAPCNVCESKPVYAAMHRLNPDGSGFELFASGIRNTVGFDWHPQTHELWFTDNGRDWMGDDAPPDELDRAPHAGMHFGFPYCEGGDLKDPDFGARRPCSDFEPPVQKLGPHVASLGMRFYRGAMFPAEYRGRIFIAEHGSWNRSSKVGYRVTMVTLDGNRAVRYEPFATGWLQGEDVWGRPVDVQELADGSLLVSDDFSGTLYRIVYKAR